MLNHNNFVRGNVTLKRGMYIRQIFVATTKHESSLPKPCSSSQDLKYHTNSGLETIVTESEDYQTNKLQCLYHKDRQFGNKHKTRTGVQKSWKPATILWIVDPEDDGTTILRNVETIYQSTRHNFSEELNLHMTPLPR